MLNRLTLSLVPGEEISINPEDGRIAVVAIKCVGDTIYTDSEYLTFRDLDTCQVDLVEICLDHVLRSVREKSGPNNYDQKERCSGCHNHLPTNYRGYCHRCETGWKFIDYTSKEEVDRELALIKHYVVTLEEREHYDRTVPLLELMERYRENSYPQ